MPSVGFEPTVSAGKRPQTYALDRAATGTGKYNTYVLLNEISRLLSKWIEEEACRFLQRLTVPITNRI